MKHLFIINPVAGGKKNNPGETVARIKAFMDVRGENYEVYLTKAPLDATRKTRMEVASGEELRIYACGGDGTLNECINGAVDAPNAAVTHFPCGTGNDFVKMFGEENTVLFKNLSQLVDGFVHPVDVIDCGGRYGVNICSVGFDARVGTDVHKFSSLPFIGGAAGYVVSLIVNLFRGINQRFRIRIHGTFLDAKYALLCACNGRFYGGGFNPVTDAMPDDGIMNVLVVNAISIFQVPVLIGKYAKGRYSEVPKLIKRYDINRLELSAPKSFVVNIDGEAVFTDHVTFSVIPGGVNFLFPKDMKDFFRKK